LQAPVLTANSYKPLAAPAAAAPAAMQRVFGSWWQEQAQAVTQQRS
jgi:hypothetical protein